MRRRDFLATAGAASLLAATPNDAAATPRPDDGGDGLRRTELWTAAEDGTRIHVREVVAASGTAAVPLLLVHGARPGGTAAFDLPVPGGSLAADLARFGHAVYVMDVRGFGRSEYPPAMAEDPAANAPLVRSNEAVADIAAATALIRHRHGHHAAAGAGRLAAFGWATGGHWLGMYAALYPGRVTDLIVLNTLYSGTSPWPLQPELADPERPGEPLPQPAWRAVTAESLTARWDAGLPDGEDADARRDPAVRRAFRRAALRADPTSDTRTPPSFRNPTGPLVDAFYLAQGRQFYDASLIRARTLVVRSGEDYWSRPEDAELLAAHLTSAPAVRSRTLAGAAHHVHLERPAFGRDALLAEIRSFLGQPGD